MNAAPTCSPSRALLRADVGSGQSAHEDVERLARVAGGRGQRVEQQESAIRNRMDRHVAAVEEQDARDPAMWHGVREWRTDRREAGGACSSDQEAAQ